MSNYPAPPSYRMAWDRDGSIAFQLDNAKANPVLATSAQMKDLNDEKSSTYWSPTLANTGWGVKFAGVIFPEHRDIDAAFFVGGSAGSQGTGYPWETSVDSTNGVDGTWVSQGVMPPDLNTDSQYRSQITSKTILGCKAVRFGYNAPSTSVTTIHLYGEVVPGENPDRIELWHPTLDQKVGPSYFDEGDTPRGSSEDYAFRAKNLSASKTALSVRVAMEALTDGQPSIVSQHTLSLDGSTWGAQVNVGDLAPGQISPVVTMRRTLLDTANLSLATFRLFAESTSAWV